jgi:hypothetical protein
VRAAGKLSLWLTVFTEDTSLESKLCNHWPCIHIFQLKNNPKFGILKWQTLTQSGTNVMIMYSFRRFLPTFYKKLARILETYAMFFSLWIRVKKRRAFSTFWRKYWNKIVTMDPRTRCVPGSNPTKHDSPNFTHICKIFSQICVKFHTNLWKTNPFMNICKLNLAYFTNILQ